MSMGSYINNKLISTSTAIFVILCAALYIWNLSAPHNHILSIKDCGETFIAQHQVQNFRLYGFKHGLLEDHATSMDESQHTFFYTHNANIGALCFQILDFIGVKTFAAKQVFTLFIFSLGLLYVFLSINYITKSKLIAFVTLLFSLTDINQVLSFATNALRAWHWLAIFGMLYHVSKYAIANKTGFANKVCILTFMTFAFGIGYEFFAICMILAIFTVFIFDNNQKDNTFKNKIKKASFLIALAMIPFIARQIQVACVMGLNFWLHDFYYSFVIKVPFVVKIFPLDFDVINAFYAEHNVLRPPASPAGHQSPMINLNLLTSLIKRVLIPESGFISVMLFFYLLFFSGIYFLYLLSTRIFHKTRINNEASKLTYISPDLTNGIFPTLPVCKLFLVLTCAFAVGLYIFLPFSLHVFLKHQFPLVAILLHFAKAVIVSYLLYFLIKNIYSKFFLLAVPLIILGLFVDHAIVHWAVKSKTQQLPMDWINFVRDNPDSAYAVSWIPSTVASFNNNWVIGIKPGNENKIAKRYITNGKMFLEEDLFLFGQNNSLDKSKYLQPDYWIYFRTDNITPYDRNAGARDQDYLLKHINKFRLNPIKVRLVSSWVSNSTVGPGSIINFGGILKSNTSEIADILMLKPQLNIDTESNLIKNIGSDGKYEHKINFNFNTNTYYGEYTIPDELFEQMRKMQLDSKDVVIPIIAIFRDGTMQLLINQELKLDLNAIKIDKLSWSMPPDQLEVDDLIRIMKTVPVVSKGDDYVIFDVGGFK